MKAFRIVEPGRTDVVDIPSPAVGPGEVKLRVARVGLCGTDLSSFRGKNALVRYPRIPGHEISAVVSELGPGVSGPLSPGTPVFVVPYASCGACPACRRRRFNACRDNQTLGVQREGAATEFIVLPSAKVLTQPGLSLAEMALVEPLTIGFHAIDRGRVASDDVVAVFGSGTVGLGAIAAASRRGARVIAVDVDDAKLALARRAGASSVVNSASSDARSSLRELTAGNGPDVVVEAVGLPETYRLAVEVAAFTGRLICLGYCAVDVPLPTRLFVLKELDIVGSRNAAPSDLQAVAAMLAEGAFPREALVSRVVGLEGAGAALAEWSADPAGVTKIHIELSRC